MLLCICGALRAGSTNRLLLEEAARLYGGPCRFGELRFPLYDADLEAAEGIPAAVESLTREIAAAEAVAISGPEYNSSISGVLKNALDWVSRIEGNPWLCKPVALMGAAAGRTGAARSAQVLRLAMMPFRPRLSTGPEVLVPASRRAFDAEGRLTDERARRLLGEAMERLREEARG